ncbi:hypothetical protein [Synechococcus sp. GEYO]|uniref:hypothetical protein n=1 Tax=Synechococcus sp. GEYO TaxID=2575511 RepID=UPI0010BE179C|nr:hypothetical protein [Synechococcus sp. GEYO]
MDDLAADLSLSPPTQPIDGLLELSLGSDEANAGDALDLSGDISLSTDKVFEHVDDPIVHEAAASSLIDSDEDIYASLLIEDDLKAGQSVVLNSTIDQSLMPGNISPVLLEQSQDDPLLSPAFSFDELLESNSAEDDLAVDEKDDATVLRDVEIKLNLTSEEIVSVALDQGFGLSKSDAIGRDQNWSIAQITHDNHALEDSEWNAFSIDVAIPDLQSFSEEKLYLETRLVGGAEDAAIDIHVFDNRKSGVALTGLSLDLAWNAEQLSLNESQFEQQDVFSRSRAPLFQSLGETQVLTNEEGVEIQSISGLTAAALPLAGSGSPIGKASISGSPESTIFASIPVHHSGSGQNNGFSLQVNEAVQTNGVALHPDELVIMVDEQEMHVLNIDRSMLKHGDYVIDVINASNHVNRVHLHHTLAKDQGFDETRFSDDALDLSDKPVAVNLALTPPTSPLLIESSEAELLSSGVWKQSVSLEQDQSSWTLSLDGLFPDRDRAQQLDVIQSGQLPSWLQFSATDSFTAGELIAQPKNADVGNSAAQLSFIDRDGQLATLLLDFAVENINDAPLLRRSDQPLALTIDSDEVNQSHRVAGRLDLSELFQDPDQIYGDDLEFSIIGVIDHAGNSMDDVDWLRITHAATELGPVESNVDLRPELSVVDDYGQSRSISIEEVADLDAGSLISVDIVLSDRRSIDDPGLIAVDFDIQLSESLALRKDSVTLSTSLPIFQNIDLNDELDSIDFSTLSIQAGALPRFGMGESVGERSHVLSNFTLEVSDPTQVHSIGISPGQGPSRDGLLDLSGESIDTNLVSSHSLSSRSASYLEVVSAKSLADGQYLVEIQAIDGSGENVSYQLPILVGSPQNNDVLVQPLSSALLRQMSSTALTELWQQQFDQSDSLSFSESIALGGLSHLASFDSSSIQSAVEDGRFHISPSLEASLPLLALYSEGSSLIQADTVLQREAGDLLENAELVSSTIQAPLGALEFSLTGGQKSSIEVVNIAMAEGGVELNRLYKSTREGELLTFASEVIVPPEGLTASGRDQWLHELSYSIYDYSLDDYRLVSSYSLENGFSLNQQDFKEDIDLNGLDGSAYLIDFDNDGLTDMISLALVDQGHFDLDQRSGFIKDPVVPIYDEGYATSNSSLDSSSEPLLASPSVTLLPGPSQSTSHSEPMETLVSDIGHKDSTPSSSPIDLIAPSALSDQIAGIDLPSSQAVHSQSSRQLDLNQSSPISLSLNSTQKGLHVSNGQFGTSANIEPVSHSSSSLQIPSSVSSPSFDPDDSIVPPLKNVFVSRRGKSSNSLDTAINNLFSLDGLSSKDQSLRGLVDDLSIHLSDLGGSLLAILGLTSVPHLSQLSMPALHRIKRRQPLSITQRLNESKLQRTLPIPGTTSSLSLLIHSGRLSIEIISSPTSSHDDCYALAALSDLYRLSSQPGLFADECLAALQNLTSDNSDPMDWQAWLKRLSTSTCSDVQIGLLNKTLSSANSELNLLLSSSPSAADLHMAAEISGLLMSKGFACSDLPGYSSKS